MIALLSKPGQIARFNYDAQNIPWATWPTCYTPYRSTPCPTTSPVPARRPKAAHPRRSPAWRITYGPSNKSSNCTIQIDLLPREFRRLDNENLHGLTAVTSAIRSPGGTPHHPARDHEESRVIGATSLLLPGACRQLLRLQVFHRGETVAFQVVAPDGAAYDEGRFDGRTIPGRTIPGRRTSDDTPT